jgi:uncharacterized protein
MLCPNCQTQLTMTERQGIEIDYCPSCRGVWLDRGELDKIIERSNAAQPQQPGPMQQPHAPPPSQPWGGAHHAGHDPYHYKKKRRKSFLEELFD